MADLLVDQDTRLDVVKILENHRRECEKTGDYKSAEVARQRLETLREVYEAKQTAILGHKQDSAIDLLREEGDQRRKEFERRWAEEEFPALDRHIEKMRHDLAERQAVDAYRFQARKVTEQYKPKKSASVISDKRRLDAMGAQGDYAKAKELKLSIEEREKMEEAKVHRDMIKSWRLREKRFNETQEQERDVLEAKIMALRKRREQQKEKESSDMQAKQQASVSRVQLQHLNLLRKTTGVTKPKRMSAFQPVLPPIG
jgi:hypothetical protein